MDWFALLQGLLTILMTSMCGYCTWYLQKKANDKTTVGEALKVLLRKELKELYIESAKRGYVTLDEVEEYTAIYELYHDKLGGNGTGTALYESFKKLPIKEGVDA